MDSCYYLESFSRSTELPQQILLDSLPITVGRSADSDIVIPHAALSRRHARFEWLNGAPTITDLGSTNGSFVNQQRISDTITLSLGDVVHFAGLEYCLKQKNIKPEFNDDDRTRINVQSLSNNFPIRGREFLELLANQQVTTYRQSIIDSSGKVFGHELLGRGRHPGLNENPYELFYIASQMSKEVALSELFRQHSFACASSAGMTTPLFFNCHPLECDNLDRLFAGLQQLRQQYPQLKLIFEVHEKAITDFTVMREIRAGLQDLDIGLAYDDFGAGQARLLELAEAPPDVLKFDISLVKGVGAVGSTHHCLLSALNALVKNMGIATLAEGVETQEVADACSAMGIDYLQGYFFDRPTEITY